MTGRETIKLAGKDLEVSNLESHMRQQMMPDCFVVDHQRYAETQKGLKALLVPLAPKHLFGNEKLPVDPRAAAQIRELQNKWEVGEDGFGAIIFSARGTLEYKVEWAMINPKDFYRTQEQLLELLGQAKKHEHELQVHSLGLIYAAVTGLRPPGDTSPPPLAELPVR